MSDLHALSGAYAVDALDDLERARFERHLAECEDCGAEVRTLREAAAVLAEDAALAPPPGLRARVLAAWQPWSTRAPTLTVAERVLQADDAEEVTLAIDDGSSATLTRSVSEGRAVITTDNLPAPPSGRVYELWLQDPDGGFPPAGLLPVAADQTVMLEGDASQAITAGITIEPAGGSPQPTSPSIALFDLQQA